MHQRILAVTTLLILSVACRDGPTMIDGSAVVTPPANAAVSVDQLSRVRTLMDDPFVRELVVWVAGGAIIDELDAALKAVGSPPTEKEIQAAWHVLNALRVRVGARTATGESVVLYVHAGAATAAIRAVSEVIRHFRDILFPFPFYLTSAEAATESLILQDVLNLVVDDAMTALLTSGDGS